MAYVTILHGATTETLETSSGKEQHTSATSETPATAAGMLADGPVASCGACLARLLPREMGYGVLYCTVRKQVAESGERSVPHSTQSY